jgi:hypothetical protein
VAWQRSSLAQSFSVPRPLPLARTAPTTWRIHLLLKAKVPAFVVVSLLVAKPTRSAPKLLTTSDRHSQGAWPLTSCAPSTFASSGAPHLLFFSFPVLLTSPLLWRGVLDTLAVALIPALFFFGSFRSYLVGFCQLLGFESLHSSAFHTSDSGVCFFPIFLDTCRTSMALFLFVLFSLVHNESP